jgi:hypothetical protein
MTTRLTGSSNNGSYLYVDYNISTNTAGNYTLVSWTVGVHWGTYYFNIHDAIVNMSTTVSGATASLTVTTGTYNSGWPISGSGPNRDHPFKSGTTRIDHNPSTGAGNIRFVGSAFWDTPSNFTSTISQTVTLPTFPRASPAPTKPVLSSVTSTSLFATFTDGSGGATIDSRQLAYHTTSSITGATIISSDGSTSITGLSPGTTYYVWARTHNAAGYSPWSPVASTTTLRTPTPPSAPTVTDITQTSVTVAWTAPPNGGSPITGYDVGYGTDPMTPTTVVASSSPKAITGLTPGTRYYFWVRARNAVGNSAWSVTTSIVTLAAAYVKVGAVWKFAIPYVRTGGVWKVARPWARTGGVWKETT